MLKKMDAPVAQSHSCYSCSSESDRINPFSNINQYLQIFTFLCSTLSSIFLLVGSDVSSD